MNTILYRFPPLFLPLIGLALIVFPITFSHAQDGPTPIDAPETYTVDLIGVSTEETSHFTVTLDFDGTNQRGERITLNYYTEIIVQPEPNAYVAILEASGDLRLFGLAGRDTTQKQIQSELYYQKGQNVVYIDFPQTDTTSCGKQTTSGRAAIYRLEAQTPFPSEIFITGAIPPVARLSPDGSFGDAPTARYFSDDVKSSAIKTGRVEAELLPDENRLVMFSFEGEGQFLFDDATVNGTLRYTYQLFPTQDSYGFDRPQACQTPLVYGVPLYEPSVNWVTRELDGSYLAGQSIKTLIEFHQTTLAEAGFTSLGEPFITDYSAGLSYEAPDGTWIRIDLTDVTDGTQVAVRVIQ